MGPTADGRRQSGRPRPLPDVLLCYPQDYPGTQLTHKVDQARRDEADPIVDVADSADVRSYMDHESGLISVRRLLSIVRAKSLMPSA